jgi:hypothetical protein
MPFTLCHPAIVIPLYLHARRITSLPALVIGSMMPDAVYFFSFGVSGRFSHSVAGIALYCVPAGALVYSLYCATVRPALLAWLPQALSARMAWHLAMPWRSLRATALVLASLAIGALSHIAWDSFTHPGTAIVSRFAPLRELVSIGGHAVPVFNIAQHASSLAGLIVIAASTVAWMSRSQPGPAYQPALSKRQRLLAAAAVGLAGVAGCGWGLLFRSTRSTEHALFSMVTSGMACAAAALVLACLAWHRYQGTRQR